MSSKVTLINLSKVDSTVTDELNTNFTRLADAIDTLVSRDGTAPNQLEDDIDANNNQIKNLGVPVSGSDSATKQYIDDAVDELVSASFPLQSGNVGKFAQTDGTSVSWENVTFSDVEGTAAGSQIVQSNVTQHESALTLTASQTSDFDESVDDRINDLLSAGAGISLSYDDGANTLTITNTDSGSGDDAFSGAEATRDTTISVPNNSATIIAWDGELFDTDDYHESVTNPSRLTVPTAGKYLIGGTIEFSAWSTLSDGRLQVRLFKNGSFVRELIDNEVDSSGGDGPSYSFQTIVDAAANDYFELSVVQASGGSRNLTTNSVFYAARLQGSGPSQINDLSDVSISSPADNEILAYNNSSSTWVNQTSSEAGLLASPTSSTDPGLAFDTWRTPDADRVTLVEAEIFTETDGSTDGVVDIEVDESGGTTPDYNFRKRAEASGSSGDQNQTLNTFFVPAGGSYRIVNLADPNSGNDINVVREFTL